MADQRIRFIAEWADRGLKQGAQDANKSLEKMRKQMELTANLSKQKYEQGMQDAAKATKEAEEKAEKFRSSLKKMAIGAAAAGVALKKAYDFAKQGAEIELASLRFDRLSASIGTTGDALRDDLADATDGLMSKAEQMQLAGELMALGLVKTHDEAVRLTKISSQLGMNMNQLVLTLTNRTTMRFDALGVAVDGFDEKVQALEESGLSVQDAFTEAFLQQAEEQIERVGSVAETTAGQMMMFEATWKDFGDNLKVTASQAVGPLITRWNLLMDAMQEGNISRLEANWLMFANTLGFADERMEEVRKSGGLLSETTWDNIAAVETSTGAWEDLRNQHALSVSANEDLAGSLADVNAGLEDVNQNILKEALAWEERRQWVAAGGQQYQEDMEEIMLTYKNTDMAMAAINKRTIEFVTNLAEIGNLSLDEITQEFTDLGYEEAIALAYARSVLSEIGAIDGTVANADIFINVHGRVPNLGKYGGKTTYNPGTGQVPTVNKRQLQQAGGDFVVPPAFAGDSFPVMATAGERVQVTTASNTKQENYVMSANQRTRDRNLAVMIADQIAMRIG